jgi:hypothetical protein
MQNPLHAYSRKAPCAARGRSAARDARRATTLPLKRLPRRRNPQTVRSRGLDVRPLWAKDMAELARFHAIDTFGSNSPDETEEGKREREVALFAVVHVEQMVRDLEKAYDAGFRAAHLR